MKTVLFVFSIFISVLYGVANTSRLIRGNYIPPMNHILFAVGFTGMVTHFLEIW